jgi:ComF family protein
MDTKHFLNHVSFSRDFILDLIFPIECLSCGKEGAWLCQSCFRKLPVESEQFCPGCKKINEFGNFCSSCSPVYFLDGVWVAGNYKNKTIASLIKNLKYHFAKDLSKVLGEFLISFLRNLINKARINSIDLNTGINSENFKKIKKAPEIIFNFNNCLIIPVPLHKRRERWRGFNQTKAIAEVVSRHFNLSISHDLIRVKHRPPQAKLGAENRKKNIQGCFSWLGKNLKNTKIILLDDVATTCSTLEECAKILKQSGAKEVWGLVIARG